MIRLNLQKENYWLELPHGVRVFVCPLSTAVYEAARAKASRSVQAISADHAEISAVGGRVDGLPDLTDEDARVGVSQLVFAQSLARAAIIEWEGVGDENGQPIPVQPESVDELMMLHSMAESFLVQYLATHNAVISEGNA